MKKINKLASIASLVLSFTAMDVCADGILPAAEWWSGPYYGAYFGAGAGRVHGRMRETQNQVQTSSTVSTGGTSGFVFRSTETGYANRLRGNATGSEAELFVGYNFHRDSWPRVVWGGQLEGTIFNDITFKSVGTRVSTNTSTQQSFSNATVSISQNAQNDTGRFEAPDELKSLFSFVARGGILARPDTLVYGLVGLSEGNFVKPTGEDAFGGKRSQWEDGITAGAGVEHKFNPNWSVILEYRYLGFDIDRTQATVSNSVSSSASSNNLGSASASTGNFFSHFFRSTHNDLDFHMGKVGIVFRA